MPLLHRQRIQKKSSGGSVSKKKLKSFKNITRKTTVSEPLFNEVSGVQPATLSKIDIETSVLLLILQNVLKTISRKHI